jgi:hypothetical protein
LTSTEPTDDLFEHGVVHIAGPDIQIGHLLLQRCSWCGELLVDYNLIRVAAPVGQPDRPATWPVGGLVLVDGGVKAVVRHTDGDPLPPNSCVGLPARWEVARYGEPPQGAVDAVLATWAQCSPYGDPAQPLRCVNDSALNRVDNLARLAAKAVLAGPPSDRGGL